MCKVKRRTSQEEKRKVTQPIRKILKAGQRAERKAVAEQSKTCMYEFLLTCVFSPVTSLPISAYSLIILHPFYFLCPQLLDFRFFFLDNSSPIRTHCLCANATTVLQEILLRQRNDYTEKLPFSVTFMQHPPPPPHHYRCPHHPFILIVFSFYPVSVNEKRKVKLKARKNQPDFHF